MNKAHAQLVREVTAFTARYPGQEHAAPEATEFVCAICGKPLVHMKGQRKDGSGEYDFFSCSDRDCNASYPNVNGKPGEARKKPEATKFKCKTCGKSLVRRESAKGPFFGCSGYPGCKKIYQVAKTASLISRPKREQNNENTAFDTLPRALRGPSFAARAATRRARPATPSRNATLRCRESHQHPPCPTRKRIGGHSPVVWTAYPASATPFLWG